MKIDSLIDAICWINDEFLKMDIPEKSPRSKDNKENDEGEEHPHDAKE